MLRYIFMGTPPLAATILEKLCTDLDPPAAIVTQLAKAQGRGQKILPTAVEQFARGRSLNVFSTLNVNAPETVAALRVFQPDVILVAAFGQILRDDILNLPKLFCLNVHASLLPKYRGAAPIQRAIWNGDAVTGVTIQKMAKKLDTGDVLLQKETNILPDETSGELMARLATLGAEALVEAMRLIDTDHYEFVPQDETLATYASKIDKADALVDWNQPAGRIYNQVRALQPWPVAETLLGTDRLKIFGARIVASPPGKKPGEVTTDGKTELVVTCGDGRALSLTMIQLENRKRLDVRNFLMAYRGTFPFHQMGNP